MWDGFNSRKFPRLNLTCRISLMIGDSQTNISAHTENVGAGGVCIILKEQLERFSSCQMQLDFGEPLGSVKCRGKVAWVIERKDPKKGKSVYDTGVEFLDISEDDRKKVVSFIDEKTSKGFKDLS